MARQRTVVLHLGLFSHGNPRPTFGFASRNGQGSGHAPEISHDPIAPSNARSIAMAIAGHKVVVLFDHGMGVHRSFNHRFESLKEVNGLLSSKKGGGRGGEEEIICSVSFPHFRGRAFWVEKLGNWGIRNSSIPTRPWLKVNLEVNSAGNFA